MDNSVYVSDHTQIDRILREERKYILDICNKIKKSGCNVLLIQKSILRDATSDLSLSILAKLKILVVKDVERDDIEFISKVLFTENTLSAHLPVPCTDHPVPTNCQHRGFCSRKTRPGQTRGGDRYN